MCEISFKRIRLVLSVMVLAGVASTPTDGAAPALQQGAAPTSRHVEGGWYAAFKRLPGGGAAQVGGRAAARP